MGLTSAAKGHSNRAALDKGSDGEISGRPTNPDLAALRHIFQARCGYSFKNFLGLRCFPSVLADFFVAPSKTVCRRLGFGEPLALSASHGDGMVDLASALIPHYERWEQEQKVDCYLCCWGGAGAGVSGWFALPARAVSIGIYKRRAERRRREAEREVPSRNVCA